MRSHKKIRALYTTNWRFLFWLSYSTFLEEGLTPKGHFWINWPLQKLQNTRSHFNSLKSTGFNQFTEECSYKQFIDICSCSLRPMKLIIIGEYVRNASEKLSFLWINLLYILLFQLDMSDCQWWIFDEICQQKYSSLPLFYHEKC